MTYIPTKNETERIGASVRLRMLPSVTVTILTIDALRQVWTVTATRDDGHYTELFDGPFEGAWEVFDNILGDDYDDWTYDAAQRGWDAREGV